jgi:hypothetical protein
MRRQVGIWVLGIGLVASASALAGDPVYWAPPPQGHFLQRVHPVGGWHPYGGGLLHWWNPHCFPQCGGPDDYCRKPPPSVCWPPYPPYYTWGPPLVGPPCGHGPGVCSSCRH